MVFGEDPRKPVQIDNELLCESCYAIVDVLTKKVGKKWTEDAIYTGIDGICKADNFRVYKMIPPTLQKGCEAFLDRYGDGLEETLYKAGAAAAPERACASISVCKSYIFTPPASTAAQPMPPQPKKSKNKSKKAKKAKKVKEEEEAAAHPKNEL